MTTPIRNHASIYRNELNKPLTSVNALTASSSAVVGVIREKPANAHRVSRPTIVHPGGHRPCVHFARDLGEMRNITCTPEETL
ncbi:Uncharacterised protein [Chlamydia trachomatis]|nr:Uncharacterised protein [Chlamydia trachomatis]